MGVAVASIRLRDSQVNTVANMIETANALWQLVEDAGMVRVPTASYAGQAGRLVAGSPGPDQTQAAALTSINGLSTQYFNVYKHPTLNFYVKLFVCEMDIYISFARCVYLRYGVFFDLDGAGSHVASGYTQYDPHSWYTGSNASVGTSARQLPATYKNTFASVGPDHFYISSEPHTSPSQSYTYASFYYAPGKSLIGFGVFSDTDGAGSLAVVLPAYSTNADGNSVTSYNVWGSSDGGSYNNAYRYTAIRYWTHEPSAKVPLFRGGAAAGFILDAATPNTGNGTRVQQGQLYINGVLRRFNFGFVAEAALADQTVVELNLTGTGVKKYRVSKAFGPANPGITGDTTVTNYDTTSNSCILLPWNAP